MSVPHAAGRAGSTLPAAPARRLGRQSHHGLLDCMPTMVGLASHATDSITSRRNQSQSSSRKPRLICWGVLDANALRASGRATRPGVAPIARPCYHSLGHGVSHPAVCEPCHGVGR